MSWQQRTLGTPLGANTAVSPESTLAGVKPQAEIKKNSVRKDKEQEKIDRRLKEKKRGLWDKEEEKRKGEQRREGQGSSSSGMKIDSEKEMDKEEEPNED